MNFSNIPTGILTTILISKKLYDIINYNSTTGHPKVKWQHYELH